MNERDKNSAETTHRDNSPQPLTFLENLRSSIKYLRFYWSEAPWYGKVDLLSSFVVGDGVAIGAAGGASWGIGELGNVQALKEAVNPMLLTGSCGVVAGVMTHVGLEAACLFE